MTRTAALALVLCAACGPPPGDPRLGEPRFVSQREGLVDFSVVRTGLTATQSLEVQNAGGSPFTIRGFEWVSGDAVRLDAAGAADAAFSLSWQQTEVPAGETRSFTVSFTAAVDAAQAQVQREAVLAMLVPNARAGSERPRLTLRGLAFRPDCAVDDAVDFGGVERGDVAVVTRTLRNPWPFELHANVGEVQPVSGAGIAWDSRPASAEFVIPPGGAQDVSLRFAPTVAGDAVAQVTIRAADGCPAVPVRLLGTGLDSVLSWTPATVDFGTVPSMSSGTATATFSNLAFRPVRVMSFTAFEGAAPSQVFAVAAADPGDLTTLTVPRGTRAASGQLVPGTADLTLSFRPQVAGLRQGTIRAMTDTRNARNVVFPMRGTGGP